MPDPIDDRDTAGTFDRLGHGTAGADVVDHGRSRLSLEDGSSEERGHEVARHELARVVDEEAAVGVAVERNPEIGAFLFRLADDELAILGKKRIGLVVGERPVGLEEAAGDGELRQAVEHRREHHSRHAVCRVHHHAQRPDRIDLDEGEDLVDESGPDVLRGDLSSPCDFAEPLERTRPHLLEAGVAPDRQRAAAHDLHPGVLARVMRGGNADPAVEPELADRVVHHLRPHEPDVAHLRATVGGALDRGGGHRGRRDPHVPAHGDRARLEVLHVRPADAIRAVFVEL